MSEEESFVILGTSPLPSLRSHGSSLLHDALDSEEEELATAAGEETKPNVASTSVVMNPASNTNAQTNVNEISVNSIGNKASSESSLPTTLPSQPNSLAASFILGDVNADVLKNSVYSQFPSLCSVQASAEDVVKLQTMMTEYMVLKKTLDKVNHTMQEYYKISQQWRKEADDRDEEYKKEIKDCRAQIEKLNEENQQLKREVEANFEQMRLVEQLHQKEHDELRQSVSEKASLITNMRFEIDKLQKHQVPDYEYVPQDSKAPLDYVERAEHERQLHDLRQQMSGLLAENLEIGEMKKTYIEEIDCLKVSLTSAEELMKAMRADINLLKAKNVQNDDEIAHLKTQVDIYRRDFEMERADREKNAGEKEQYLVDLRALQRRNQELIEALAEAHKTKSGVAPSTTSSSRSSLREEQRPVRVLDPTGAAATTAETTYRCPICSKPFGALSVLQSHVNDCLDKV
ncbi:hypothetical protein KR222_008838 [Zaprionus bogoriensis]|nr:hypothetical protein KR222_008838 [Zaprionus bogoriensis]